MEIKNWYVLELYSVRREGVLQRDHLSGPAPLIQYNTAHLCSRLISHSDFVFEFFLSSVDRDIFVSQRFRTVHLKYRVRVPSPFDHHRFLWVSHEVALENNKGRRNRLPFMKYLYIEWIARTFPAENLDETE